eukprot:gnl/MRDRNA2_/MRDRNA2_234303_c0_seq1.p1 gnl/MRDRNA2_/MRDRNA2_234303_c0~~gnl/MRDRNA2_/MRDRNA2_234303_c0_seq1.p1  ORF type:complete len:378 (-),score=70.79 gnl/MRDRNA2_/MRDRNA2_234303_c0_seq1:58-1035(-)
MTANRGNICIRPLAAADVDKVAEVVYASFRAAADAAGCFNYTAQSPEFTRKLVASWLENKDIYGAVASHEEGGSPIGSSFLLQRGPTFFGYGPLNVAQSAQGHGVGRALLADALSKAGSESVVRLVMDSYNNKAFALYFSMDFAFVMPLIVLGWSNAKMNTKDDECSRNAKRQKSLKGVSNMCEGDIEACTALAARVCGHRGSRRQEIEQALRDGAQGCFVMKDNDGCIQAYTTALTMGGHTAACDAASAIAFLRDATALLNSQDSTSKPQILCPLMGTGPHKELLEWCLREGGWSVVKQMLLMEHGGDPVQESKTGVFIPTLDG